MKTMCKQCEVCRTYWYERTTRNGDTVEFKYCEGNKDVIRKYNYGISHKKTNPTLTIINSIREGSYAPERGKTPVRYLKKDSKNLTDYINRDLLDLRLKNLREITKSCLLQKMEGKTSIYPGVSLKHNKYHAKIKIKDKTIYLGNYENELDAYHAYVLKHKELGIKINKETRAHRKYMKEYDPKNFIHWETQKKSRFKGLTKNQKTGGYVAIGIHKGGKREYIIELAKEVEAFHAYVLWCNEHEKKVEIENKEYQDFLKKEKPSMSLKEFIKIKKKHSSKCKYVSYYKNKDYVPKKPWRGRIIKNGETILYHYYKTEKEACKAVEEALKEYEKRIK